jgi:hypothetical protein
MSNLLMQLWSLPIHVASCHQPIPLVFHSPLDFRCFDHRVHTEWRLPISGVHPMMMEKSALDGESGDARPTPFSLVPRYLHVQSCRVGSSWEGRYTPCISSLPYMYSRVSTILGWCLSLMPRFRPPPSGPRTTCYGPGYGYPHYLAGQTYITFSNLCRAQRQSSQLVIWRS